MKLYITTKEIIGSNPDGPDCLCDDDGTIILKEGMIITPTGQFSEYTMEFLVIDTKIRVDLNREWGSTNVSDPNYYANYFSLPEGLKEI